jgi:hypothetical protein
VRFFPVRDRSGAFVANQWIMVIDYQSINFDYQDNVYLISNIRPSNRLPAPEGAVAFSTGSALSIDWNDVSGAASYNIYRSDTATGKFKRINTAPLTSSIFADSAVLAGNDYFYRITAVNSSGVESLPITASGIV